LGLQPARIVLGLAVSAAAGLTVSPLSAQTPPESAAVAAEIPSGLARLEMERSRQCVPVLARLDDLEGRLEPLAMRSQRLIALANAIALEDRTAAEPFDSENAVDAEVAAWFERDLELATAYIESEDEALVAERDQARQAIKEVVSSALADVQAEADSIIAGAGSLTTSVGGCDGAILVRPAVLEACEGVESPVCEPARNGGADGPYRFVDDPADLWQVEEVRPWTSPSPLGVAPDGQIGGARTVGYARNGNVTLSLAFSPLLGSRDDFTPEQLERFQAIIDSAGFSFEHPSVAFVPALALRASVPEPLAGETLYVLHFDSPDNADALWTGEAGTGTPVEVSFPVAPRHLGRLAAGDPLSFTAVAEDEGNAGSGEAVYSVQFTPLNQSPATSALMGYMSEQLSADVQQLVPVGGR
jgi:hypothetical protein